MSKRHRITAPVPNPSGLCMCGCGKPTAIAKTTVKSEGWVKGQPRMFVNGHHNRVKNITPPNPSGICMCGCGQPTRIASVTRSDMSSVKGEPLRYIKGHCSPSKYKSNLPPNPSGLCMCGCGEATKIAKRSGYGEVKGTPRRYVLGHSSRKSPCMYVEEDCGFDTPCWVWSWSMKSNGYGQINIGGKMHQAHRYIYEQHCGPIPDGLVLDHLCSNRACVNPEHLEAVTHSENLKRTWARGRGVLGGAALAKKSKVNLTSKEA